MGWAHNNAKKEEKERTREGKEGERRIEAQRVKPRTSILAIDAPIGYEELTGEKKREQRKMRGSPPQLPWNL